jgi:hypothetical protein
MFATENQTGTRNESPMLGSLGQNEYLSPSEHPLLPRGIVHPDKSRPKERTDILGHNVLVPLLL